MITRRAKEMKSFIVMDVLERAQEMERSGRSVIHLEVGEPDFDTPEPIKEACLRAIRGGETHYTHSLGLVPLREAICEQYAEKYGVEVSPDQILITSGTSPAMLLLFSALLEPGAEVILPNPYYPCYPNFISYVGGESVLVDTEEKEGFQYLPAAIKKQNVGYRVINNMYGWHLASPVLWGPLVNSNHKVGILGIGDGCPAYPEFV